MKLTREPRVSRYIWETSAAKIDKRIIVILCLVGYVLGEISTHSKLLIPWTFEVVAETSG
jgi:hypothetical protein